MKKNLFPIIAGAICCSIAIFACFKRPGKSYIKNVSTEAAIEQKLKAINPSTYGTTEGLTLEAGSYISIIASNSNDSYWTEVKAGAERAIADLNNALGYTGEDKIKLSFCTLENPYDINEQVNLIDKEMARISAAVCIAAIDPTAYSVQLNTAADTKLPIITLDSATNHQNIATHISTDNIKAAKTAADEMAKLLESNGEVAIFVQDSISISSKERLQGFLDTIKESYPNISATHIYYLDDLGAYRSATAEAMNDSDTTLIEVKPENVTQEDIIAYLLDQNPNIDGVYATSFDSTQLVANALIQLEQTDLSFIGFDGGPEQMALLQNDLADGIIIQNPFAMGYASVVAAARLSLGLANESYVNTGYTYVTKDNMEQESIQKMLY